MSKNDEIRAFREIVVKLLEVAEDPVGLLAPRALFADALHTLKKGVPSAEEEHLLLRKEFLAVLDEKMVTISKKNRAFFLGNNLEKKPTKDWKTPEVWRDAYAHEKRILSGIPETDR